MFSATTSMAFSILAAFSPAYQSPQYEAVQTCMAMMRNQAFYTDKCISMAFPTSQLWTTEACYPYDDHTVNGMHCEAYVRELINGEFVK